MRMFIGLATVSKHVTNSNEADDSTAVSKKFTVKHSLLMSFMGLYVSKKGQRPPTRDGRLSDFEV
jgi:hypothetical protein